MAKELEAKLSISGELEASLKNAIKAAEKNMETFKTAADKAEGATAALNNTIKSQEKSLRAAQKMYQSYVLSGDQASKEAQDLAAAIDDLTWDLESNKAALSAAEDAARGLASRYDSIDDAASGASSGLRDTDNAARTTEGGFTVLKGAIANVAADAFQSLISGAGQAVSALMGLSEQTRELRQDIASLETAFGQAEFTAGQAQSTYTDLYAIFGESDRAVETANNISRMSSSQEDLNNWVRITTGAWGMFQDALPVENLAEAAGETAKTGTVTGGLADALNWSSEAAEMFADYMGGDVVSAEDAFNVALSECSTEQERQQLITETLLKLYGDAATQYEDTSGSLMDANRAAAEAELAQARLGEIIEPVTTQWTIMKTELMNAVAPALEVVAGKAQEVLTWLQQHPAVLQAVVTAAAVLAGVLTAVGTAMIIVGAASAIASAGMLPIIAVVAAVAAAIGILILVATNLGNIWDWLKTKASALQAWLATTWENIKTTVSSAAQAVVDYVSQKWSSLQGTVRDIWNGVKDTVQGIWDKIKDKAKSFAQGVVDAIRNTWSNLSSILTAPFSGLSGVLDSLSSKATNLLNKLRGIGSSGSSGSVGTFAAGGFTNGPSIAGEAGTEAVISFDPAYRADNLRYWAAAGRMLGVEEASPLSVGSSGSTSSSTVIESVNFAPNITITGNADKQDIISAIRETYPEFRDLIEEVLADREVGAYA